MFNLYNSYSLAIHCTTLESPLFRIRIFNEFKQQAISTVTRIFVQFLFLITLQPPSISTNPKEFPTNSNQLLSQFLSPKYLYNSLGRSEYPRRLSKYSQFESCMIAKNQQRVQTIANLYHRTRIYTVLISSPFLAQHKSSLRRTI